MNNLLAITTDLAEVKKIFLKVLQLIQQIIKDILDANSTDLAEVK